MKASTTSRPLRTMRLAVGALAVALVAACSSDTTPPAPAPAAAPAPAPTERAAASDLAVCDNQRPGPASPPDGAVVVDPTVDGDLAKQTKANPPGTTFWLAPGTHTLGTSEFGQVVPEDGNTYIGAPGAVLDGRGMNRYAFTQKAANVTVKHLTVQGFEAPRNEGVVNHDSGNGWLIEHNTIQDNGGAAMMSGSQQVVRHNCLRDNGQYGINAYQAGNDIADIVIEHNEITGNNTDDWETRTPGCGCTGGVKFWSVDGADVRSNWVHDNRGVGLWADSNDNDFLIENNLIENNDSHGLFYEASYNLILRGNTFRGNAMVKGAAYAARGDKFPIAAIYLSEAGGDPRVPARTDKVEIYDNVLQNNWAGIAAWENADRFCNSPANTSSGMCTMVGPEVEECSPPGIVTEPLYSDCRWKTQRVDIHANEFIFDPDVVGCENGLTGQMAVFSNFGTYPDWSPYQGRVVQQAITFEQQNSWHDNSYTGPWRFVAYEPGNFLSPAEWQAAPYGQDTGSEFTAPGGCPSVAGGGRDE